MNTKLTNQLDQLDKQLNVLLDKLGKFDHADFNNNPKEGAWSVNQVMLHLKTAELLSQKYVEKKLSFDPVLKKASVLSSMRSMMVTAALKSPIKRKAPSPVGEAIMTGEDLSFWDLAKQWKEQRQQLRNYIANLSDQRLREQVYKHPFGGRMSIADMLKFFDTHFKRHEKQINRILENYKY